MEYHRLVGVDHFFLYDTAPSGSSTYNNTTHNVSSSTSSSSSSSPLSSTGSSGVGSGGQLYSMAGHSLRDMLKDYLALGLVTIVPWHHPDPPPTQPQPPPTQPQYLRSHHQTETTQEQEQAQQEQDHQRENPQLHRLKSLALTSCYTR